ncbi:MAG: HEPN domain-containing protein [Candidatus Latescibacterota bacterium]
MSVPHEEVQKKVLQWITYADEDLTAANHIFTLKSCVPYRLIAWHAQQCAEKYIKAYLVFHHVDFPYTHRILYLLELCPERDRWDNSLAEAEILTPFAVMTRYPGEDEPVSAHEAKHAVKIAEGMRDNPGSTVAKRN